MKIRNSFFIITALLCMCLAGCEDPTLYDESGMPAARQEIHLYYIDETENELKSFSFTPENMDTEPLIEELLSVCTQPSADGGSLIPLLSDHAQVEGYELTGDILQLNFTEDYVKQKKERELLVRAGLVKTFTQVEEVSYVEFLINGNPLTDNSGSELGRQSRENYIEDASSSISSYKAASMVLYFADETGSSLVPEDRNIYYNSSEPLEQAVVEEILNGPSAEGHYPSIPSETKVLGVTIQEGICYVNLDETFNSSVLQVEPEVQIYSIVNSIVDTCHVSKVQFSINGSNSYRFHDELELGEMYEKNEEIISGGD